MEGCDAIFKASSDILDLVQWKDVTYTIVSSMPIKMDTISNDIKILIARNVGFGQMLSMGIQSDWSRICIAVNNDMRLPNRLSPFWNELAVFENTDKNITLVDNPDKNRNEKPYLYPHAFPWHGRYYAFNNPRNIEYTNYDNFLSTLYKSVRRENSYLYVTSTSYDSFDYPLSQRIESAYTSSNNSISFENVRYPRQKIYDHEYIHYPVNNKRHADYVKFMAEKTNSKYVVQSRLIENDNENIISVPPETHLCDIAQILKSPMIVNNQYHYPLIALSGDLRYPLLSGEIWIDLTNRCGTGDAIMITPFLSYLQMNANNWDNTADVNVICKTNNIADIFKYNTDVNSIWIMESHPEIPTSKTLKKYYENTPTQREDEIPFDEILDRCYYFGDGFGIEGSPLYPFQLMHATYMNDYKFKFVLTDDEKQAGLEKLKSHARNDKGLPIIAYQAHGGWETKYRQSFEELAPMCKGMCEFVIMGDLNEFYKYKVIDNATWIPPSDIRDAASILYNCDAYIGFDSGLSFIAAALSIPSIVLYATHDPNLLIEANNNDGLIKVIQTGDPRECFAKTGTSCRDVRGDKLGFGGVTCPLKMKDPNSLKSGRFWGAKCLDDINNHAMFKLIRELLIEMHERDTY